MMTMGSVQAGLRGILSGDTVTIHQDGHKSLTYANR